MDFVAGCAKGSIAFAMQIVAILQVNNMRDAENDKLTVAKIINKVGGRVLMNSVYYSALMLGSYFVAYETLEVDLEILAALPLTLACCIRVFVEDFSGRISIDCPEMTAKAETIFAAIVISSLTLEGSQAQAALAFFTILGTVPLTYETIAKLREKKEKDD